MKKNQYRELRCIFAVVLVLFFCFLAVPVVTILFQSFGGTGSLTLSHYREMLTEKGFLRALGNSFLSAGLSSAITTVIAFCLAYIVHYTSLPGAFKRLVRGITVLPMLLPTITYGFAIIYSFGKQGLVTRMFHHQFFEIYGLFGLIIGYVVYTLPVSFLLICNTMEYVDKKFTIVSRIMGDPDLKNFFMTVLRPLSGTMAASFIQCFFLAFTDFGIPASVGGQFRVAASVLYDEMLGSVPDFAGGAVVAMVMLLPSIASIGLLQYLNRFNVRYSRISTIEIRKNPVRDVPLALLGSAVMTMILTVFAVVFLVPFVSEWPYNMSFTMKHVTDVLGDPALAGVFRNSLAVAVATASIGSVVVYGSALVTARSSMGRACKKTVEQIALVTNTIPGMVLGIAFLLVFSGTPMQNTFVLIILCNVIHFFSTPYLMMKNSLEKMNAGWETTAMLMGDTWIKTIVRVVTPNAMSTILEVFSYYFVSAMVTVSAVIFIAGARTMVITTKIKELQHFAKFNEIFVLSLCILFTNIMAKALFGLLAQRKKGTDGKRRLNMKKTMKAMTAAGVILALAAGTAAMTGCSASRKDSQVIIYSNADDEAVEAIKAALDSGGYEGKYLFQTFGTSELGGKLLAEKSSIEADLVTMSSFYLESAQNRNSMFKDLGFEAQVLSPVPDFYRPITSQEGAVIVNTELMKENGLPMPASIKDLADPVYKDMVSVTDIKSSSTAWLLIQALVNEYGTDGAREILTGIYQNAGPHIESSGSGPIKKVRAGEVAVGFGLRHQAAADKAAGLPVDYVDPAEGNFSLTESVAVIDKGDKTNPLAMEMAECIVKNARPQIQKTYPNPLYVGESSDGANRSANPKVFPEQLTAELLKSHQDLSESCK